MKKSTILVLSITGVILIAAAITVPIVLANLPKKEEPIMVDPPEIKEKGYKNSAECSFTLPTRTFSDPSETIPFSSTSEDGYYRVSPVKAEGETLSVFNLDGTINKTLKKSTVDDPDTWYVDYEDVALYYLGYHELPVNHFYHDLDDPLCKDNAFNVFGQSIRYFSQEYTRNSGYMRALPKANRYSYFEVDVDINGGYVNKRGNITRGAGRLVIIPDGLSQYNDGPSIFFTDDHYSSFYEITGYAKYGKDSAETSFVGPNFDGEDSGYGTYQKPVTVTL